MTLIVNVNYTALPGPQGIQGVQGPAGIDGSPDSAADVKIKYESNADTNAFTDAEKTKLGLVGFFDVTHTDFEDPSHFYLGGLVNGKRRIRRFAKSGGSTWQTSDAETDDLATAWPNRQNETYQ